MQRNIGAIWFIFIMFLSYLQPIAWEVVTHTQAEKIMEIKLYWDRDFSLNASEKQLRQRRQT